MNKLANFKNEVAGILGNSTPGTESIVATKSLLCQCLSSEDFLMDCVDQALFNFEEYPDSRPQPPLFVSQTHRFAAHLLYWPPHFKNSPHKHLTWGVTGVIYNRTKVNTYSESDDKENSGVFVNNTIRAERGEVGYLLPHCIHNLENESGQPSATLHLFGADDKNQPASCTTIWYGDEPIKTIQGDIKSRAAHIYHMILKEIQGDSSDQLLERAFKLASNQTKLDIVKTLNRRNAPLSLKLSIQLEAELSGRDKAHLHSINERMKSQLENAYE